jgi:hypothetical protein
MTAEEQTFLASFFQKKEGLLLLRKEPKNFGA